MSPPAWSSLPESGLNFTCTKPSVRATFVLTHQGYVPAPDCFRTFDWLGAEGSASTDHRGAPLPVTPACQPSGRVPGLAVSKVVVSAEVICARNSAPVKSRGSGGFMNAISIWFWDGGQSSFGNVQ